MIMTLQEALTIAAQAQPKHRQPLTKRQAGHHRQAALSRC